MVEGVSVEFPQNAVSFCDNRGGTLAVVQKSQFSKNVLGPVLLHALVLALDQLAAVEFAALDNVDAVTIAALFDNGFFGFSHLLFHG